MDMTKLEQKELIAKLKRKFDVNQSGVATLLLVSQPAVAQYEAGTREMSPDTHLRAAYLEHRWLHRNDNYPDGCFDPECKRCEQLVFTAGFLGVKGYPF